MFHWLELETNIGVGMTVVHKEGAKYLFPPGHGRILTSSRKAVVGRAIHQQSGEAVAAELPLANIEKVHLDARIILHVKGERRYQFEPPDWEFVMANGNIDAVRGKGVVTDLRLNRNSWVEFQIPLDQVNQFQFEDARKPEIPFGLRQYFLVLAAGALFILVLVYSGTDYR